MDIFVNRPSAPKDRKEEQPNLGRRKKRRERRRSGRDRRKAVNEGLVVSLSISKDRRSHRERRQRSDEGEFCLPAPEEKEEKKQRSFSIVI